jgi:hypothetical protein
MSPGGPVQQPYSYLVPSPTHCSKQQHRHSTAVSLAAELTHLKKLDAGKATDYWQVTGTSTAVPLAAELAHLKKLDAGEHKYLLVLTDFIFNPLLKVEILPAQKKKSIRTCYTMGTTAVV